jgi:hypothetical protein
LKAIAGDVAVLKKDVSQINVLQNEVKELRTCINSLVDLVKFGAASDPNSLANSIALEATCGAVANAGASTSAQVESNPKERLKKKETKAAKAEAVLSPKYTDF